MLAMKCLSLVALAAGAAAQASFGAKENSAAVLAALKVVDSKTITSGQAAAAYKPGDNASTNALTQENQILRANWNSVQYLASSSAGFYTPEGAQAIIDFVNTRLYPDTRCADEIYRNQRNAFVAGGFLDFINTGLLQLRAVVDATSAAVQAKTPARQLTPATMAFTLVEQDYANVQEFQQFGR